MLFKQRRTSYQKHEPMGIRNDQLERSCLTLLEEVDKKNVVGRKSCLNKWLRPEAYTDTHEALRNIERYRKN